jgi:hypothetical protein
MEEHFDGGRMTGVLADWCAPFPGCHLYDPSAVRLRRLLRFWSRRCDTAADIPQAPGKRDR